jgi:tetraacyldisaccharide 4'-kinase
MMVRLLLLPLTILYAIAIAVRNFLYSARIITRTRFDFPIICIGNLSAGGTGKTPHIEWLIRLLESDYKLAVLSRGYKRKTVGYVLADEQSTTQSIGDEPYQITRNFPNVAVAVSENRVLGIPHLLGDKDETEVILMDDGLQHLPIQPGFSIILTDYSHPFYDDWLLPSGRLREFRSGYKRAQIIIVTKCPPTLSNAEQQQIIARIKPQQGQHVFFTTIQYGPLTTVFGHEIPTSTNTVLAVSGIASPELFVNKLQSTYTNITSLRYSDHQEYTNLVLTEIAEKYRTLSNAIIVTTQKDAVKLNTETAQNILGTLPVFYMPIQVQLIGNTEENFRKLLTSYITNEQLASEALTES